MTTETVQIHKPRRSSKNEVAHGRTSMVDLRKVQDKTVYKKLFNLEPNAEPEKPLKIDLDLYQLER